jgi:hypothetical protein
VGEDPDRFGDRAEVQQRLPHSHEHDVRDALRGLERFAHADDLLDDLGGREIPREAERTRGAERARHRAAHLRRQAQRDPLGFRYQHRFDLRPVGGAQDRLQRAVARTIEALEIEAARAPALVQPLRSARSRSAGEIFDAALVDPRGSWSAR